MRICLLMCKYIPSLRALSAYTYCTGPRPSKCETVLSSSWLELGVLSNNTVKQITRIMHDFMY